jgi:hypothetical protein
MRRDAHEGDALDVGREKPLVETGTELAGESDGLGPVCFSARALGDEEKEYENVQRPFLSEVLLGVMAV